MVQVTWPRCRSTDHSTSYMFSLTTQHTVAELKTAVILSDWQYLFQSTSAGFWQVCVDREQDFLQTRSLLCFVNHMTTHTHLLVCVKYIYVHACMYYSNSICWLMCCTSYRYRQDVSWPGHVTVDIVDNNGSLELSHPLSLSSVSDFMSPSSCQKTVNISCLCPECVSQCVCVSVSLRAIRQSGVEFYLQYCSVRAVLQYRTDSFDLNEDLNQQPQKCFCV